MSGYGPCCTRTSPGAWDFARALNCARRSARRDPPPLRAECRSDRVSTARRVSRALSGRRILAHASRACRTRTACSRATAARVPIRFSTKHGFNRVPRSALLRRGGNRAIREPRARPTSRSPLRGLAPLTLEEAEGFDRRELRESSHYGHRPGRDAAALWPTRLPRPGCAVGRLNPRSRVTIVLLRAFADARRELPELRLDIGGFVAPLEPAFERRSRWSLGGRRRDHVSRSRQARCKRRSSRRRSSSCRRWAKASGWWRSSRW